MFSHKKILITCGPTWVAIDDMRVISNRSTGEMGQLLAQQLKKEKCRVTLLEGAVEKPLPKGAVRVIKFKFYDEFLKLLKKELKKNYDIVIHAAAVSDYKPNKTFKRKISSELAALNISLTPTIKIINLIKRLNPKTFLVGFKLEPTIFLAKQKAKKLFRLAECDLVVANSVSRKGYQAFILNPRSKILAKAVKRKQIAQSLVKILKQSLI